MTKVRLDLFDSRLGLNRERSKLLEAIWYLAKMIFFLSSFPWPYSVKRFLLRCFGAQVGRGVLLKPRVNIHFPWKLEIGEYAWLGEECFILNFEKVKIGAHACLSQRSFICTGNHDFRDSRMSYRNAPINIEGGAWIGAQVFVAPGLNIGTDAVVTAGSVVLENMPSAMICSGNPCVSIKPRWKSGKQSL